jgi:hypothetical protein
VAETLALLYAHGVDIDWRAWHQNGRGRCKITLPTYPFERRRHWLQSAEPAERLHVSDAAKWDGVREAASRQSGQCALDLDVWSYPARWDELDRLTIAFIVRTLRDLKLFETPGDFATAAEWMARGGIAAVFQRLFERWLRRLTDVHILRENGDGFAATVPLPADCLGQIHARAERVFGTDRILLDYVTSCGNRLSRVLTGEVSPLDTLFPNGSFAQAEAIYQHAPYSAYFTSIARSASWPRSPAAIPRTATAPSRLFS